VGRNSYLGGSTLIHRGNGALPVRKSRPSSEVAAALQEQKARAGETARKVTAFLFDGGPEPKIEPAALFDTADFYFEAVCVHAKRVRSMVLAYQNGDISDFEFLTALRAYPKISVWKYTDGDERSALVVYLRASDSQTGTSGIVGAYPSHDLLTKAFADEGWVIAREPGELAAMRPAELRDIGQNAGRTSSIVGRLGIGSSLAVGS
jgi:hypothetical protein